MALTNKDQQNTSFTAKLQGWATGAFAKTIMGIALGYTIYKTQIIQKIIKKIRGTAKSKPDQTTHL